MSTIVTAIWVTAIGAALHRVRFAWMYVALCLVGGGAPACFIHSANTTELMATTALVLIAFAAGHAAGNAGEPE